MNKELLTNIINLLLLVILGIIIFNFIAIDLDVYIKSIQEPIYLL